MNELALWRAVIVQAMDDATALGNERTVKHARRTALAWLDRNNRDFRLVCSYADVNPERVLTEFNKQFLESCGEAHVRGAYAWPRRRTSVATAIRETLE